MESFIEILENWKATLLGGVALAVSLALMLLGIQVAIDPAWITVFISGLPLLYEAVDGLAKEHRITSALLISVAMAACIFIGELFAAGEVAFIMALGELLEDHTVKRAKRGLSNLVSLVPDSGRRIVTDADGKETEEVVPATEIRVGDRLRVLPGERISVDGKVIEGNTSVDQAIMTGESLPVDKAVGDNVFCGTTNRYGTIDITATSVGEDSSLQKMIKLVREAENNKAPMQRTVDKWAEWLVPISLLIAIVTYFVTGDLVRGVTVLVVFCPCALALATPVSIVAGIGQATKFGVLIKSGEALERMGQVDTITLDKTGTLTEGRLSVSSVAPAEGYSAEEVLGLTASLESRSEHPLGKAIVGAFRNGGGELLDVQDVDVQPGKGISGVIKGRKVVCGKGAFLAEHGVSIDSATEEVLTARRSEGMATVLTAVDGRVAGVIALADVVRPAAKQMVSELRQMGVEPVMLTGDHVQTARHMASLVGISQVQAELLPADKVRAIETLQSRGHRACMIGDGVNDAPALKTAHVGVAMGTMGSDIAIDSADIALMGDDIAKIPYLKRLSLAVVRSIKLNISLSMLINLVAITLSVMGLLGPISGALVHNVGSVLVVLNAALLYDRKV